MKLFKTLPAAALVAALGFALASCTDKIDNSATPSVNPQEQQESDARTSKAQKFWNVVSQLVDVDEFTEDYEDKTFEPVYGEAIGTATDTRYVYTNSAAAAAKHFADLIETDGIDENTQSYTYSDSDVGTLVYTKGTGRELATVTVDIKQIPSLKKIVYMPGAYANGSFTGKAYYRFGDVVGRTVDGVNECWICVRPSFGLEGKGDSHWVCLSHTPEKNIKTVNTSTNKTYYLPTGVGNNHVQMQNLAEMLFAIFYPDEWYANADLYTNSHDGLELFNDFKHDNLKYHNAEFWKNVQAAWKKNKILQLALNYYGSEEDFADMLKEQGLHLLYNGYSWLTTFSWNCSLYEAIYKNNDNVLKERNMHKSSYETHTHDMRTVDRLDCRFTGQYYNNNYIFPNYRDFFIDDDGPDEECYRWVIRHATGRELSSNGTYDKKGRINGVSDQYRYYRDVYPIEDLTGDPEETMPISTNADPEAGTYLPGDVVSDEHNNRWFCVMGSPVSPQYPGAEVDEATFISFDFNDVNTTGNTVAGLPTPEQVPELSYRMLNFVFNMEYMTPEYQFQPGSDGQLGRIGQHILDYAGVDLRKITTTVDSVFVFNSQGKTFRSASHSIILNFAYNDGPPDKQAVCRSLIDNTMAGDLRTACVAPSGKTYNEFYFRAYQHYETFDLQRMQPATADETALGINDWCRKWVMTADKICLQDVASQNVINRYASQDKWVTLPLTINGGNSPRRQPKTQAEASARPSDYIGRYGPDSEQKTNIFNEPVCFFRVMKVKDLGQRVYNLVSTDGRKLRIVHVQDDRKAYQDGHHCKWVAGYCGNVSSNFYLDNKVYKLQPIKGLEYLVLQE